MDIQMAVLEVKVDRVILEVLEDEVEMGYLEREEMVGLVATDGILLEMLTVALEAVGVMEELVEMVGQEE